MKRLIPLFALAGLVPLSLLAGCNQAPVDGGWEGEADCDQGEDLTVEAILDQDLDTDVVRGTVFVEFNIDFGFLGILRVTSRGEVDDGEWDPQSAQVQGKVVPDDVGDGDPAPTWIFDLEFTDDEFTTLEGQFNRLNGAGEVINSCDLELDKAHDPSN